MANSLGFWTDSEVDVNLHFNLWKLPYKKKKRDEEHKYFLDTGLLLKKSEISEDLILKIFVPFSLENQNFLDLSEIMIKDKHLLNATFNRPLVCVRDNVRNRYFIKDEDNVNESFFMHTLKDGNIKIIKYDKEYSEITIKINKEVLKEKDTYIRFRVNLLSEKFSTYVQDDDYFLKSAYKKEELVEFRINELRNLSIKIQDFFANELNKIKVTQIHYFLVRSNDANLILSHKAFKRCRSVEHNIWQQYINDENCDLKDNKSILSYHWSESGDDIPHYGAFAKFSYTRSDRFKLYLFIFIFVSIILELVANGIYDLITGPKNAIIDVFTIMIILLLLIPSIYYLLKFGYHTVKEILNFLKFIICCRDDKGD